MTPVESAPHLLDPASLVSDLISKYQATSEKIKPNIFIPSETTDRAFNRGIKIMIERVETNPVGRRLLEKIRRCTSQIYISYGREDKYIQFCTPEFADAQLIPPSFITYSMQDGACLSTKAETIPLPAHVILFHELTHAYHNSSGKRAASQLSDPLVWESDEEYKTIVGFPSKNGAKTTAKITENAFRKAEGLPERFGSWAPSSLPTLEAARLKLLGSIHERNQSASPLSASPPPIALCSIHDLGVPNRCVARAEIQGVNGDFTLNPAASTVFFRFDPTNSFDSMLGTDCFRRPHSEDYRESELAKNLVTSLFPKLKDAAFKIKSVAFLRLSEQEFQILQNTAL